MFEQISVNAEDAIKRAKKLKKYHGVEQQTNIIDMNYNPSTDAYKIVEYIMNKVV